MFLTDQPAMYVDEPAKSSKSKARRDSDGARLHRERGSKPKRWLCVADLHIGTTKELFDAGIRMPSQVRGFVKKIHKLKKSSGAKGLILLGDVKHKVPGISYQEMREIPEFLEDLKFKEIILIKGNHDAEIEKIIPAHLKGKVKVKISFKVGDFMFTHGHRHVKTAAKTIVIGHNQPAVMFRDQMKARYIEPCWVRGPMKGKYEGKELIIVPAFNELRGHTIVNKDKMLGPIAKTIDPKEAHVFLLDGTDLGPMTLLKKHE